MIALWVLLGLLLLILILLLLPCRISLSYHNKEFAAALHYLWLRFPLLPAPEKKKAKDKPQKAEKKPSSSKSSKKRSPLDYLGLFNDFLPALQRTLRRAIGRITLVRCRVTLTVAQEDAGDTAIRYGYAQALVHNVYAFLANHIRVREYRVQVLQDYIHGPAAEDAEADLLLRITPLALLSAGVRLLWHGGTLYLRLPALQ